MMTEVSGDMPMFAFELDFDIDAAFAGATSDIITDEQLALDEKVRRMENIIQEGSSEIYRDFVDFRALAAQIEMFCSHDHSLREAFASSESLGNFIHENSHTEHDHSLEEAKEAKKKKDKKKVKYQGWLQFLAGKANAS